MSGSFFSVIRRAREKEAALIVYNIMAWCLVSNERFCVLVSSKKMMKKIFENGGVST
jgi:hypothetical protein